MDIPNREPTVALDRTEPVIHRPKDTTSRRKWADDPSPPKPPIVPIEISDSEGGCRFTREDEVKLASDGPGTIIDAIRQRIEVVQRDAAVQQEAEEIIRSYAAGDDSPAGPSLNTTSDSKSPEETQFRLRILEDENKMLRRCLLECVRYESRDQKPSGSGLEPKAGHMEALTNEVLESWRKQSVLEDRVSRLEDTVRRDSDIFEMLLATEPVSDNKPDCEPAIRHIQTKLDQLRSLSDTLGPALTIRGVLTLKMLHQQRVSENQEREWAKYPEEAPVSQHTPAPNDLDTVLSLDQAIDMAAQLDRSPHLLDRSTTCIRECAVCKKTRFLRMPPITLPSGNPLQPLILSDHDNNSSISSNSSSSSSSSNTPQGEITPTSLQPSSEFNATPTGQTPCCHQRICDTCFYPAVVADISPDWWRNLGSHRWLACPGRLPNPASLLLSPKSPSSLLTSPTIPCPSLLPLSHTTELRTLLRAASHHDPSLLAHTRRFTRARRFRAAVAALRAPTGPGGRPEPLTHQALLHAAALHARLQGLGWMMDPLDWEPEEGDIGEVPRVEVMEMDSGAQEKEDEGEGDGNGNGNRAMWVPVFTGLLVKRDEAEEENGVDKGWGSKAEGERNVRERLGSLQRDGIGALAEDVVV